MERVLITGANGFIGSHLVTEALNKGFEVKAGIRKTSTTQFLTDKRIQFVEIDYNDIESVKARIARVDYIIHNAGITQAAKTKDFFEINFGITKTIIEAIKSNNYPLKKFIYISSFASFGPGDEKIMEPVKITDKQKPVSGYGKSKLEAELYIKQQNWLPYIIFNPTAVYGPRETNLLTIFKMVKRHIEPYIGLKNKMLSFIYVKDLAKLVINSLTSPQDRQSYLISDGNSYSSTELNKLIKEELKVKTFSVKVPLPLFYLIALVVGNISKMLGKPSIINIDKYKELKYNNWSCNADQTFKEFSFKPEYYLAKGIKETIEWYKSMKWL